MTARLKLFIVSLLFSVVAYGQDIVYVGETENSITLDVTVLDVKEKKAVEEALPVLYQQLFFRGIPDSDYCKNPLVGTDEKIVERHSEYFKQMTEKGRFASFVTSKRLISYKKKNKHKEATVRYVVNTQALRKDLESHNVKRRFGF